jgi:hypothetical protein
MADTGTKAFTSPPDLDLGGAMPFCFEVTWQSLTRSLQPALVDVQDPPGAALLTRKPASLAPPAVLPVEAREWEMILPRMKRQAPLALAPPVPEAPRSAPQFAVYGDSSWPRRLTLPVIAAALVALGAGAYQWLLQGDARIAQSGMEVGSAGWISEWASDAAGSARGRQLSLYRPSVSMSDYNLVFLGRIERRSLGWVFRATDSSNYYAAKVEAAQPGTARLAITRFAVINGVEGPHFQRPLPFVPQPGEMLRVRLEAHGPRFTISIQNHVVEDWEDEQLKAGAVGFLNERGERGQIGSIQISFPKGGSRR